MKYDLDTKELIKEISNVKIQIGVEKKLLEKNEIRLKKLGIKTTGQAKEELDKIDKRLEVLQRKKKKLIAKAIEIIDKVK